MITGLTYEQWLARHKRALDRYQRDLDEACAGGCRYEIKWARRRLTDWLAHFDRDLANRKAYRDE